MADYNVERTKQSVKLGMSRSIMMIKKNLHYKQRKDLEDHVTSTIWIEFEMQKGSCLIMGGYRQWTLPVKMRRNVTMKQDNPEFRLKLILEKIVKAKKENKDIIVMMDTNVDTSVNSTRNSKYKPKMLKILKDFLQKNKLTILNEEFTRF